MPENGGDGSPPRAWEPATWTYTPPVLREPEDNDELRALLTADAVEVQAGLELLSDTDTLLEDISDALVGGEVEHQLHADVQTTCQLMLARELDWRTARLRPYYVMSAPALGLTSRFDLGVFLPQTPETPLGDAPTIFDVRGDDKVSLLQYQPGDTRVVTAGTNYLTAVKLYISESAGGTRTSFSPSTKTLPRTMVWALRDSEPARYIDIVNDLLSALGFEPLWVDGAGFFRSDPFLSPSERGADWDFDLTDPRTNVVGGDRTRVVSVASDFNWWRFVAKRGEGTSEPVEGDGRYTVNLTGGGQHRRRVEYVTDVADHAALVAYGDAAVAADRRRAETLEIETGPLPTARSGDVVEYTDPALGTVRRAVVRSLTLPLDGSDMRWNLEVIV